MLKYSNLLLYAAIALSICYSQAQLDGCCSNALGDLLQRIAGDEQRWNTCEVDKLNLILAEQNQVETQLTAIHNKLESKMPANFEKIGTRFFYIEQTEQKNWFGASDACRQMGGQLATIRTRTEQAAIERKLTPMQVYWVDVTDLAVEGEFVSMASGKPANYLNWGYGEPDNYHDFQHCIFLYNHYMYDSHCNTGCLFICEAIDENPLTTSSETQVSDYHYF